jgi:hypothetical protein
MATASSEYFVVKPTSAGPPENLPVEPAGSTGLFVFRNSTPSTGPRQEWDRLMREYGDHIEFVAPVMVDDKGGQMLPTGKIVVQFYSPPSGEALQQFEKTYRLRYLKTNEFKREQLSFEALDKTTYPPDLIATLRSDSNIKLAAPETMARYSRV